MFENSFSVNLRTKIRHKQRLLILLPDTRTFMYRKRYIYTHKYTQQALMLPVHVFVCARGGGAKPNWKSAGAQFHTQFHQQLAFSAKKRAWSIKAIVFLCRAVLPLPEHTPLNAQTATHERECVCVCERVSERANDCMHSLLLQPRANWWCMVRDDATPVHVYIRVRGWLLPKIQMSHACGLL